MRTKKLIAAAAALMMLAAAGCSDARTDSSKAESRTDSSTADSQAKSDESSKQSENDKLIEELSAKVKDYEELSGKVEELSKQLTDLKEYIGENFTPSFHEIYDDTAVIEAYKKGDGSALTDEKDKYIFNSLTKAVKEIIKDGMSEYEKEKAVYDYIFKGTHFNYSNLNPVEDDTVEDNSHTPYGFFHDHSTICVGYATTFKLFMDALGIECEIIHSTQQGEHAWDLVKIDGDWYHVDIFYDGGEKTPLYGMFNVNDEIRKANSDYPWSISDHHECTSLKYNNMHMNAKKCKDVYGLPKLMKDAVDKNDGILYAKLPVPKDVDATAYAEQIQNIFYSVSGWTYAVSAANYIDKDENTIYVSASITEYEPEPDEPDPDDEPVGADIDTVKLAEEFDKVFEGKVVYNTDIDEDYYESPEY